MCSGADCQQFLDGQERSDYEHEEMEQAAWFGIPWPEFNHGLIYTDTVKYATSASRTSLHPFPCVVF